MSKLKNIEAVQKMLVGEHKTQTRKTFGISDANATAEKNKKREVGEVWYETDHKTQTTYKWEQKDGYRTKVVANLEQAVNDIRDYTRSFPNCQKEVCTCTNPTRLDNKFKALKGMCEDCVMTMETRLKIQGKFNEYALTVMKNNAESFFKQSDKEVEELKNSFRNPVEFVENADGRVEKWTVENPEFFIKQIDEQYAEFKNKVMEKLEAKP